MATAISFYLLNEKDKHIKTLNLALFSNASKEKN